MSILRHKVLCLAAIITMMFLAYDLSGQAMNDYYIQGVRIGLVDEFFDRFNGKEIHPDISKEDSDFRMKNLLVLFDLDKLKGKSDSLQYEAEIMMNKVITDSIILNFADSGWMGIATCDVSIDGKNAKLNVYLTVEEIKPEFYKWVISDVKGNVLDIAPAHENENIYMLPNAHEMNFLQLHRITEDQPKDIKKFLGKNVDYDMTSVFSFLLYSGKLKLNHVENLEFVFTQIPGYTFHISYVDRTSNNSGWLITDFYKSSNEEKADLLRNVYHLHDNSFLSVDPNQFQVLIADVTADNLVDIYYRRLNERLSHVKNLISFIQNGDTAKNLEYTKKLQSLFTTEARAIIKSFDGQTLQNLSIPEFCNSLRAKAFVPLNCDSICSPLFTKANLERSENLDTLICESITHPFTMQTALKKEKPNTIDSSNLPVIKERTENGDEWIPLFGDLFLILNTQDDEN